MTHGLTMLIVLGKSQLQNYKKIESLVLELDWNNNKLE